MAFWADEVEQKKVAHVVGACHRCWAPVLDILDHEAPDRVRVSNLGGLSVPHFVAAARGRGVVAWY